MATKFIVTQADGTELEVTPTLQDMLAFESTLRKNPGWGKLEHNALKMTPFRCWNALKRTGRTELTWTEFSTGDTAALSVEAAPEAEPDDDELEVDGLGKGLTSAASKRSLSPSRSAQASPIESGNEKPADPAATE